MSRLRKIARRTFLIGSAAVVGGAAFGAWYLNREMPVPEGLTGDGDTALNPFVVIDADGVIIVAPRAEMGQGTRTTLAALVAEELDLAWEEVRVIHGPPGRAYYNGALLGEALPGATYERGRFMHSLGEFLGQAGKYLRLQVTGGSTAMVDAYERLRLAGAAAREALKDAAAEELGVDAADLRTENGAVIAPDGTALPYTRLAEAAAAVDLREPELRSRSEWRYLGRAMPRVDMVEKVTGTATFGIDVRPEGVKFAALRINPRRTGMISFDAAEALAMDGVDQVVDLGTGVAVIGSNTWLCMQAADAIQIDWEDASYPPDTEAIFEAITAAFDTQRNSRFRDDGDVSADPPGATRVEAEYRVPYLAHATMEPMGATAVFDGGRLTVWSANQGPMLTRKACADATGLPEEAVEVITPYLGGGFGRRGELDFSIYAARVAQAVPGTPVQLTWSREEDMRHDFYRPGMVARVHGAVAEGSALSIDAKVAGQSCSHQAMTRWLGRQMGGADKGHVAGLFDAPYAVPNFRVEGYLADLDVPVGFWRSVGASANGFFIESFVDEMAHTAGADPLDFRLQMARAEWAPAAAVLEAVREMSGWTGETPDGIGRGVALVYSFGTPVAMVVEVTDADGPIRMTKCWMAADPGIALDPGIIEAQLVGGAIYGFSAAMLEEITFSGGEVEQWNFPGYEALRMHNTPDFEVRILENQSGISGIGEPGTPPAAPALSNALYDLTGRRARTLPLIHEFDLLY